MWDSVYKCIHVKVIPFDSLLIFILLQMCAGHFKLNNVHLLATWWLLLETFLPRKRSLKRLRQSGVQIASHAPSVFNVYGLRLFQSRKLLKILWLKMQKIWLKTPKIWQKTLKLRQKKLKVWPMYPWKKQNPNSQRQNITAPNVDFQCATKNVSFNFWGFLIQWTKTCFRGQSYKS